MLDYGVIVPRLQRPYQWSAHDLAQQRLLDLIEDGSPTYAGPSDIGTVARPAPPRATRASSGRPDEFHTPLWSNPT